MTKSDCALLAGKTKEEASKICLNCPYSTCVLDSDNHNGTDELIPRNTAADNQSTAGESKALPRENEAPQVRVPTPEKPQRSPQVVPDKDWYAPHEITFHPKHIVFLMKHLDLLKEGLYPPDPSCSGYTDMPAIRKSGKKNAKFTKPVELAAEVSRRLEHCRLDGLMVYLHYAEGWDEYELGKYYRLSMDAVQHRLEAVLWHISGWNFYAKPYRRWYVFNAFQYWKSQREAVMV